MADRKKEVYRPKPITEGKRNSRTPLSEVYPIVFIDVAYFPSGTTG